MCYWCKDRCINPDVDAGYNPNICTSDKNCSEVPPSGSPSIVPQSQGSSSQNPSPQWPLPQWPSPQDPSPDVLSPQGSMWQPSPSSQWHQGPIGPRGPMGPQGPPGPKGIDEYSGAWWGPYTY